MVATCSANASGSLGIEGMRGLSAGGAQPIHGPARAALSDRPISTKGELRSSPTSCRAAPCADAQKKKTRREWRAHIATPDLVSSDAYTAPTDGSNGPARQHGP